MSTEAPSRTLRRDSVTALSDSDQLEVGQGGEGARGEGGLTDVTDITCSMHTVAFLQESKLHESAIKNIGA